MSTCNLNNWDISCQNVVNNQINIEYWASYQYDLMWSYFDRSDVGLKNIANFFKKSADEEREHAHKLIEYQNLRGGDVKLKDITDVDLKFLDVSPQNSSNNILLSFEKALEMEQRVYQSLLNLHKVGDECNDPQFTDFIEGEYLEEQIEAINELNNYISQLKLIGNDGHGLWNFNNNFKNK